MDKFHCVRVYANGGAKETVRDQAGMESWIEYNRQFRGGNALIVNGVCQFKDHGYLSDQAIAFIEETLKGEYKYRVPTLSVDSIGPQMDSGTPFGTFQRTYTGYRPEPTRMDFRKEILRANNEVKLQEAEAIGNANG